MTGGGERRTGPTLEAMYQLVRWLIPTLDRFPRRQKFLLGDRIQATALDGLERLVEVTFTRNRGRLLNQVNVDLDKLRRLLRLAKELGHLDRRRYKHAARRLDEVGRIAGGDGRAHRLPSLRPAPGRPAAAPGGNRAPLPGPAAQHEGPRADRHAGAGGSPPAYRELGGTRPARQQVLFLTLSRGGPHGI